LVWFLAVLGLNSGPCAYLAGALPLEPFPSPMQLFSYQCHTLLISVAL
jgi:hypothetical protein